MVNNMNQLNTLVDPKVQFTSEVISELNSFDDLRKKIASMPSSTRFTDEQIEIIYGIGHSLFVQGKFDNACSVFQMMLVYRPLDSRILSAFGLCCKRLGKFESAIPAYSAALAIEPTNLSLAVHIVECLAVLGKRDESLTMLEPLIKLAELDESYNDLRARAETLRDMLRSA